MPYLGFIRFDPISVLSLDNWKLRGSLENFVYRGSLRGEPMKLQEL